MYRLYTQQPLHSKGLVLFPEFFYVKKGLTIESRKVVNHYRTNVKIVRSNHILVRLIDSITLPLVNEDDNLDSRMNNYRQQVKNMTTRLTMSFNLINESSAGKIFSNIFFGKDSQELILTTDDDFEIKDIEHTWMDLQPIKVLRHPHTDITMPIFNESLNDRYFKDPYRVDNTNVYVVEINIPMLAVQWMMWYKEVLRKATVGMPNNMNFVASYPIVNMIYSYTDYALFNRFINTFHKRPNSEMRNIHPFFFINYYDRIDRVITGLVASLQTRRLNFDEMLFTIPAIFERNMFNVAFPISYQNDTRQLAWARNIAILPTIAILLQLDDKSNNQLNRQEKSYLRIALRKIQNDAIMENKLDLQTLLSVRRYIDTEIAPFLN